MSQPPELYFPALWFSVEFALGESQASNIKGIFLLPPRMKTTAIVGIAGCFLVIGLMALYVLKKSHCLPAAPATLAAPVAATNPEEVADDDSFLKKKENICETSIKPIIKKLTSEATPSAYEDSEPTSIDALLN